jgi:hypothetical protein
MGCGQRAPRPDGTYHTLVGDRPQRRITCVSIAAHPARADDVLTELHELGGAREGRNKALVIFRPVASDSGGQQPAQRSS